MNKRIYDKVSGALMLVMLMLGSMAPLAQQKFVIHNGFIPARIDQLANPKQKVEVPLQELSRPEPTDT